MWLPSRVGPSVEAYMAWPHRETSLLQALARSHTNMHTHTRKCTHTVFPAFLAAPVKPGCSSTSFSNCFYWFPLGLPSSLLLPLLVSIFIPQRTITNKIQCPVISPEDMFDTSQNFYFYSAPGSCKMIQGQKHKSCQFSYHSYLARKQESWAFSRLPLMVCQLHSQSGGQLELFCFKKKWK